MFAVDPEVLETKDLFFSTPHGVIGFIVVLLGARRASGRILGEPHRTQLHFHVFSTDLVVRVFFTS